MVVTSVRVAPVEKERLLAVASLTLCDCFVLRGMRLVEGQERRYVAMPIRFSKTGEVFEVFHPISCQARDVMERLILEEYERKVAGAVGDRELAVYIGSDCGDFLISAVRVRPFEGLKLRGFASLVLDNCLAVTGIKIIAGKRKSFVQMPNVRRKSGKLRDLAFPTKPEIRNLIEKTIFDEFVRVSEGN